MHKLAIALIIAFVLAGCGKKSSRTDFGEIPDSLLSESMVISQQAMAEIIDNLSSPVEIASLLKKVGAPFSQASLANPNDLSRITTENKQALFLGIFGADLGYLNIYNKRTSVVDYLAAIRNLSENLRIGQFFDFVTLKRLATNDRNLDSLIFLSVHSFNQMDDYLRTNKRGNLSALIITGTWIEGLFLATTMYGQKPHPELAERIGEQKIVLADLLLVLKNYKKDPYFNSLLELMNPLKKLFDQVTITYELGEPEMVEENGMLVIKQNEKSHVEIKPDILPKILEETKNLRNNLIDL